MDPIISVIITALNAEAYLKEAIESILSQTLPKFELFVIDDGSIDDTRQIIEGYAARDARIVPIFNEENQGQPRSRNNAMRQARGEFIAIMDADDIALPRRFEVQVDFLRKHPDVGIVAALAAEIDESGDMRKGISGVPGSGVDVFWWQLTKRSSILIHPTVMFRRSLAGEFDLYYDPDVPYAQDKDLWCRFLLHTDAVVLPKILLKYRVHSGGISQSKQDVQQQYALEALTRLNKKILCDSRLTEDTVRRMAGCRAAFDPEGWNLLMRLLVVLLETGRFSKKDAGRIRAEESFLLFFRCFGQVRHRGGWCMFKNIYVTDLGRFVFHYLISRIYRIKVRVEWFSIFVKDGLAGVFCFE
jgi:glycosyltransferase involved in cell wall biosynthesis